MNTDVGNERAQKNAADYSALRFLRCTLSAWTHQQLQRELAALSAQGEWISVPSCSYKVSTWMLGGVFVS
jgi:hypothetical protein